MGSGIAQVAAQSGLDVVVVDADEKRARNGVEQIGLALGRGSSFRPDLFRSYV